MISVTQREKIAEIVPEKYRKAGKRNYIYEINLPRINIVEPVGEFNVPYPGFGFYDSKTGESIPIQEVESFVPYLIKPESIAIISNRLTIYISVLAVSLLELPEIFRNAS